ncbi:MAG: AsmA-like C-terminal domain-containing protein [bacterium]
MPKFKKSLYIVFSVFIILFICYKLLSIVGGLYVKKKIETFSKHNISIGNLSLKTGLNRVTFQLRDINAKASKQFSDNENNSFANIYAKNADLDFELKPLFKRQIVCEKISILEPRVRIKTPIGKGHENILGFRDLFGGSIAGFRNTAVFKKLEIKKGTLEYLKSPEVSLRNFSLLSNNLSLKEPFSFFIKGRICSGKGKTDLTVSGEILNIPKPFDFSGIKMTSLIKLSSPSIDVKADLLFGKSYCKIKIRNAVYKDIKVITPHNPLYIKDRVLHIHGVNLKVIDGLTEIAGDIKLFSEKGIEFDLKHKISDVDIGKLASKFGIKNLTFSGVLDCEGNIRSRGKSIDEIKKNLNGSLDIILNNGYLAKQHIFVRMFTLINMYDVIKLRLPKMDEEGIKYSTATAKAVIDSGVINVKSLYIDGERMRISGKGDIDLVKMTTDMIFGIELMQIVDEVLNKIPIVGYIITGEDGNLLAFYVRLKRSKGGHLKATVVPHELLEDMTLGLFQRLLNLPLKMMTPIMEYIKTK